MKEHLPNVRNHKAKWVIFGAIVIVAFFMIWTMGFFGTPARTPVGP